MGVRTNDHQLVGGKQYFDDDIQVEGTLQGIRKEIYTATDGETITSNKSGAVVILGADVDVKLPTPAPGLKYKFLANADGGNAATITSTVDGSQVSNLLTGVVTDSNSMNFTKDDDVITFAASTYDEGDFCDIECIGAGSSAAFATTTIQAADGDATSDYAEDDKITFISTDGTSKTYSIVHSGGGGSPVATGTVLELGSDTGAGTAQAAEVGCIAVSVDVGTSKQGAVLNEIKAAMTGSNGHGSKITHGANVAETTGAKTMVFTQATAGLGGATVVTLNTGLAMLDSTPDFTLSDNTDNQWYFRCVTSVNNGITVG
tara:strand:+ start:531 stop:1481 length:951 start_codon:yes stop_codon:yes gene_type:complete